MFVVLANMISFKVYTELINYYNSITRSWMLDLLIIHYFMFKHKTLLLTYLIKMFDHISVFVLTRWCQCQHLPMKSGKLSSSLNSQHTLENGDLRNKMCLQWPCVQQIDNFFCEVCLFLKNYKMQDISPKSRTKGGLIPAPKRHCWHVSDDWHLVEIIFQYKKEIFFSLLQYEWVM